MNAPRICKLRNDVNKMPQFLLFPTANGGTKTIAHLSIAEGFSSKYAMNIHCSNLNYCIIVN